MENGLKEYQQRKIATIEKYDLGDIIKPLMNEVFLLETYIAGTTSTVNEEILSEITTGDELVLQRENNTFDEFAIAVFDKNGRKLGYVPERDSEVFAHLMDAGKNLKGIVTDNYVTLDFRKIRFNMILIDL